MALISILDGVQLLETRECRLTQLADGRPAALYRGLAYPLLSSGSAIDAGGDAYAMELSHEPPDPSPASEPGRPYAVIAGQETAYVLLSGTRSDLDQGVAQLREASLEIVRTGRYLGEPVNGFVADWFVRIAISAQAEPLEHRLRSLFGRSPPRQSGDAAGPRARLLAAELENSHRRARDAESEVDRLRLVIAARENDAADLSTLRDRIAEEREWREIAEANSIAALARLASTEAPLDSRDRCPNVPRAVSDEVADVFQSLLPRIRLVRDGWKAAVVEFQDRRALYRVLVELQNCNTGMPERWKTVQGVNSWIEHSKVGNGTDSQGRVYARLNRSDRSWDVLVSHKSTQDRDIDWLKRN